MRWLCSLNVSVSPISASCEKDKGELSVTISSDWKSQSCQFFSFHHWPHKGLFPGVEGRVQEISKCTALIHVGGKLSLGNPAKTTSTKLQALGGSEHHCTLEFCPRVSLSTLFVSFKGFRFFFLMNSVTRNGKQSGHTFSFSD